MTELNSASQLSADELFAEIDATVLADAPLRNIETIGFNAKAAAVVAETLQRYAASLRRRHPFLSFKNLDRLVVGVDYRQSMFRFEPEYFAYNKHWVKDVESTLGVVFPTSRGLILILHPQVIVQLSSMDERELGRGIRIFMHELCHVHDSGLRSEWLLRRARGPDVKDRVHWHCSSMWAEYFANRYSHFDAADVTDDWLRLFELLSLLPSLDPRSALPRLASTFGYALGTLAAMGPSLRSVQPDLAERLCAYGLGSAWAQAEAALSELGETVECWLHDDGVRRLEPAIRLIERACALVCTSSEPASSSLEPHLKFAP